MQNFGALDKDFAAFEIGKEVDVTLAIAQFHVGEAVEFFRQREHGLGEEGESLNVDCELSSPGAEEIAGDADVVAEVEEFVEREGLFADGVLADIDLQPLAALLEGGKAGFALGANGHDASGDSDGWRGRPREPRPLPRPTWRAPRGWCARQGTGWDRRPGRASRSLLVLFCADRRDCAQIPNRTR